ncbi:phenylalanine--tRNA ligase subunit beta [Virgibacillus alimentarius]|uniref:Phenylalanine--tRNA ligase beta subunit n=1 Tax=Virgibacillus alimentarius TaxID=698769 RepID=A0ABS4S5D1_9BACI|nr:MULTISPECIES: phenylalanine--tRNA ligase subunit beta [Virgibacillus]MBP2256690.1 phenylalanyl-tRNA synthetase beta chain [Virgibacillus alimentarius]HLR67152.1 phenylalanine--tRNA ligase subunit beta [Virgibacillus sp.]
MLVSLNWLKNYVDIDSITPEELAEKITKSGIEVDGIEYIAEKSKNVVVGYVETCEKHPNADKLNLCQVDVGDQKLQIICGAPNVRQGQKVAVAKPGAILPGNFKIKKVKLRGVESNGMICSLQELGIEEKFVPKDTADGIFVFPNDVEIGEDVEPLLNLNDAILEFDLTPNRADCLSMIGIAYEVAAILDQDIHLPEVKIKTITEKAQNYVSVEVEDKELNPYYGAFIIKDIEVKPSPLWMRNYLIAAGIRPINNVVDITNFVLLEYGQPLHAFDYDQLQSEKIVVRRAKENETLITLDEKERMLTTDNLVITNGKEPIALAGVMGGANTEVSEQTTTILLEAAYFDGFSVRKTVKATGLRSEASTRYEKGIDPSRVKIAGERACQLLYEYANGKVLANSVEVDSLDCTKKTVEITTNEINKRLGTEISTEEIVSILEKLRFAFDQEKDHFTVEIPTRRGDISIFEDMLEEVARIYGYDNLPYTLPIGAADAGALTQRQNLKRKVKNFMESSGLMEGITYSLTDLNNSKKLISPDIEEENITPVKLAMPMSEDHQFLRLSILPELLRTLAYNNARGQRNTGLYELGSIFITEEEILTKQPEEKLRLAGALTGEWISHPWQQENKKVDFYVVKGIVEGLFEFLKLPATFKKEKLSDMHPGRCASIAVNNEPIGFIGQVHPMFVKKMDLKETYVFDINMEKVFSAYKKEPETKPIPKFPSITRDIAFIVDENVVAGDLKASIEEIGAPLVKKVRIFDVYQGENLPEGKKSIAYSLVYRHPEKTLKDDEVEESYQQIIDEVNKKYDSYIRS